MTLKICGLCNGTGVHRDYQSGWDLTCPSCKGTGGMYTDQKSGHEENIKDVLKEEE